VSGVAINMPETFDGSRIGNYSRDREGNCAADLGRRS
jgi:hypothetical protein